MKTQTAEPEGPDAAKVAMVAAAIIGALFSLLALALFSGRTAFSVAAGAVIAVANLAGLAAIIRAILRPLPEDDADGEPEDDAEEPGIPANRAESRAAGKRGGAAWGGFAILKMVLLFGGVWILLTRGLVDPIPLVVGYGVLPLGITASGLLSALKPRRPGRARSRRRTSTD